MQNKAVRLDGEVYYYNETVVRIRHVAPDGALILDPEQLIVLMEDRSVFFAELDGKNPEREVSSLVKKGSMHINLERFAKEEGWSAVGGIQWRWEDTRCIWLWMKREKLSKYWKSRLNRLRPPVP